MGYAEEDIVLDAIIDNADELETIDASSYNAWQILGRYLTLSKYYSARRMLMIT